MTRSRRRPRGWPDGRSCWRRSPAAALESGGAAEHERLLRRVERLDLGDECDTDERALIAAPGGRLTPAQRARAAAAGEGLAIVAWALGRGELPAHDRRAGPRAIDLLHAPDLLAAPTLQPLARRTALRELLYAIHCRLDAYARRPAPADIRRWIDPRWLELLALAPCLGEDGDLSIEGRPLHAVDEARRREAAAGVFERHRASIWLLDGSARYGDTTPDT